jgi:hypothetical protein
MKSVRYPFYFFRSPLTRRLAESRHNLVEIFVNDSNARRTLQVGMELLLSSMR